MKGCSQKDFLCAADSSLMTTVCDGALEVVSLPHSWWVTFLTGLSISACRCCSPLPAMSVSQSARAASLTAAGGGTVSLSSLSLPAQLSPPPTDPHWQKIFFSVTWATHCRSIHRGAWLEKLANAVHQEKPSVPFSWPTFNVKMPSSAD